MTVSFKNFLSLLTVSAAEACAFCLGAVACIVSFNADLTGRTCLILIIFAGTRLAADIDRRTSASIRRTVGHGTFAPFHKAGAECIVGITRILASHLDISFGTEFVFVVNTRGCCTC
jgi:hypothetical protein